MTKAKPEYRRGSANGRYAATDSVTGTLVKLSADDLGAIPIKTDAERRVADALGLPITTIPRLDSDEVDTLRKESHA